MGLIRVDQAAVRPLGLEIRSGCAIRGEIELAGDDLLGIALHIGPRIAALAGSSQELLSPTVKDLVARSGLGIEDHGMHKLEGVPDEWHLYAVTSAGL